MAKRRFVVDFGVHVYKSYVIDANSKKEANELIDRLWESDDALTRIQNDLVEVCEDYDEFVTGLESDVMFEDVGHDWDTPSVNDMLETYGLSER